MDLKALISKLHPLERKVLPALKQHTELSKIAQAANLDETETMRALQWLENKEVLKITSVTHKLISLDKNGQLYQKQGLPEKQFLQILSSEFKTLSQATKDSNLSTEEVNASLGLLMRARAIESKKEQELLLKRGPQATILLKTKSAAELFLEKKFPLDMSALGSSELTTLEDLKRRKNFVKIEEKKKVTITLTPIADALLQENISQDVVNRLTPGMLKTGEWKNKEFRSYDITVNVPNTATGKTHFTNQAIDYIRQIWLEMGFKEMTGNYVQSAFWDLDALFVPQDHPAREMQDTFYLHGKAKLPALWEKVRDAHEHGGKTGSRGWGYQFSKEETEQILLRTHTTVLSAKTIASLKKEQLPAKFFAVGKVFRNEALDWKHLFEFDQVEGIVIDPQATLANLKGYLQEFYKKMGYEKIRMRPAHFPYTEPSLEIDVFHPVRKEWVELGGAGIFRPEVTKTLLGFDCTILAWGQGMGRIIGEYWKISDIRELYNNDLKQLREAKTWLR